MPSAVAQYALDWGFPRDLILTPDRTGDVSPVLLLLIACLLIFHHDFNGKRAFFFGIKFSGSFVRMYLNG